MARYRQSSVLVRQSIMLMALPLLLAGTSYALFSQNLSLVTKTSNVQYTSTGNAAVKYTKSVVQQGSSQLYTITATLYNRGALAYDGWQMKFDLPSDATQFTCGTGVVCTLNGVTVSIGNGTGNGAVAAGNTTTFSFTFKTVDTAYTLQNVIASGSVPAAWQTISGLSVSSSIGTRTKQGKNYFWPYTFTITNNSAAAVSAWRITGTPWSSSSNAVSSAPGTVTYISGTSSLVITSTAGIAKGANFQFTINLQSTNQVWALTTTTIEGKL